MKVTKSVWYASSGGLVFGPYATQQLAFAEARLTTVDREYQRQQTGRDNSYPTDLLVWPEYVESDEAKG